MKLVISKGLINIEGTTKEETKIERVAAKMMIMESDIVECSGGNEQGEYWTTLAYDARYQTIAEIKQIYKAAKIAA